MNYKIVKEDAEEMWKWRGWKLEKPKTNHKALWFLIALFLFISFYLFVMWKSDNTYAVSHVSIIESVTSNGFIIKEVTPEFGTKAWFTLCYNQYDTYEERITLCG